MAPFQPRPDWSRSPRMFDADGFPLRQTPLAATLITGIDTCVTLPVGYQAEELPDLLVGGCVQALILQHYHAGATAAQRDAALRAVAARGTIGSVLANRIYRD